MLYKIGWKISRLDGSIYFLKLTYKQILVIFRNQLIKKTSPYHLSLTPNIAVGEIRRRNICNCRFNTLTRMIRGRYQCGPRADEPAVMTITALCWSHMAAPCSTKSHSKEESDVKNKTRLYFCGIGSGPCRRLRLFGDQPGLRSSESRSAGPRPARVLTAIRSRP